MSYWCLLMTLWRLGLGHCWCPQWHSWCSGWGDHRSPLSFHFLLKFFSAFFFALHISTECLVFPQNVHFSSSWLGVEQNFALWPLPLHFLQVTFLWQCTVGWFFLPHFWHCSVCCWGSVVCSPKLGRTSAVCVATLLVPHSPDLIPRGC